MAWQSALFGFVLLGLMLAAGVEGGRGSKNDPDSINS